MGRYLMFGHPCEIRTIQGSKLEKKPVAFPSGDDAWVKSSHNFATAMDVLVARAVVLVTFATV